MIFSKYTSPISASGAKRVRRKGRKVWGVMTNRWRGGGVGLRAAAARLTAVVVLGQNQADERPTVLAFRRGRRGSAAFDPAQLLRQAQEPLAQNGTSQPFTAAFQRLRIGARLRRHTAELWCQSECDS